MSLNSPYLLFNKMIWSNRICKHEEVARVNNLLSMDSPSIRFLYLPNSTHDRGGLEPIPARGSTPWTGRQSITGPHRDKQPPALTLAPRINLESPFNLTYMFLQGGKTSEYPEKTHTNKHKLHTEGLQLGFEPGTISL